MKKRDYVEALQEGVYEIIFEKEDGTERIMKGTLQEDFLPVRNTKGGPTHYYIVGPAVIHVQDSIVASDDLNEKIVKVWDVEKDDWRSFDIDRVNSFTRY